MKRFVVIIMLMSMCLFVGCQKGNVEKAKEILKEDDSAVGTHVVVLFDNSISYKDCVDHTLLNVEKVFARLVKRARSEEQIRVTLILVDTEASILFDGETKDLKMAYDKVAKVLKEGQSQYTDLTGAMNRALYFLDATKAKKKMIVLFTDMKASTAAYYPGDPKVVPPPPNFPWAKLTAMSPEIYAFFVPYEEWQLWEPVVRQKGVAITVKHPADAALQKGRAYTLLFKEE